MSVQANVQKCGLHFMIGMQVETEYKNKTYRGTITEYDDEYEYLIAFQKKKANGTYYMPKNGYVVQVVPEDISKVIE